MTGLDKLRLSSFILHLFTNQSDNCDYLYFAKEFISRCSKLFYIILSKYFYFEPVSCTASARPVLSHIARYAPEYRTSSYGTITQFKCKNNFEHLLRT